MKKMHLTLFCLLFLFGSVDAQNIWSRNGNGNWNVAGNWSLGHVPGPNEEVQINSAYLVTIQSGTNAQAKSINLSSGGDLTIATGGSLSIINANNSPRLFAIIVSNSGSILTVNGTLTIDNADTGGIVVDPGSFSNTGTITVSNCGGTSILLRNAGGSCSNSGTINMNNGGRSIIIDGSTSSFVNSGTINVSNVNFSLNFDLNATTFSFTNNGTINLDNVGTRAIDMAAGNTFENNGTVAFTNITPGNFLIFGVSTGRFNNNNNGILQGAGSIQFPVFESLSGSTLVPGESPGILTFTGHQTFNGSIDFEIDGTAGAGVAGGHDQIDLSGYTATVNATLNLVFGASYSPTDGDMFQIIVAGTYVGTPTTSLSGLPAGFTATYNTANGTVTVNGSPLPVGLVNFHATKINEKVKLEWQTSSEQDNKGFEIQRSGDGSSWESLGFIQGQGNSQRVQEYQFMDHAPLRGHNYYRLRQQDLDGQHKFSKTVFVDFGSGSRPIALFPNPTRDRINLAIDHEFYGNVQLIVYDIMGKVMKSNNLPMVGKGFQTDLDLSDLPKGNYLLKVNMGDTQFIERLVVE